MPVFILVFLTCYTIFVILSNSKLNYKEKRVIRDTIRHYEKVISETNGPNWAHVIYLNNVGDGVCKYLTRIGTPYHLTRWVNQVPKSYYSYWCPRPNDTNTKEIAVERLQYRVNRMKELLEKNKFKLIPSK